MLNRVILMGRITQDIEVRQTPSGVSVVTFTIAVDRNFVRQGEERQTDFITCVAWRQQAEFIGRYFGKGRMIAVEGNLRTRTYDDKNGVKHYVTEVYVDNVSFTGEPKQNGGNTYQNNYGSGNQGGHQQGGYQQGGSYQQGGYQQNGSNGYQQRSYQQNAPAPDQAPSNDALSIGNLSDFEEVLSDDGVPF
ncbi:MAG: single-stranded DNA-binding protein [Ruminococcus sp.]|nr:single-stranded DNA-binding protein [Ruminococcus sp.]